MRTVGTILMTEARSRGYIWFRIFLVAGAVLSITLLVQSVRGFRMVSNRMIVEELLERANQEAVFLGFHVNQAAVRTPEDLAVVLNEVVRDDARVAWIRVRSMEGGVIAQSDNAEGEPVEPHPPQPGESPNRAYEVRESSSGPVLVTLRNFSRRGGFSRSGDGRSELPGVFSSASPPAGQSNTAPSAATSSGFPPTRQGDAASPAVTSSVPPSAGQGETTREAGERPQRTPGGRGGAPGLRVNLAEIALYWNSADTPFVGVLRRNLIIQVSAAIALLVSMSFLGFRWRGYVRGKQLEQQLELARTVQEGLLPSGEPESGSLDVAALCDPAYQVGGDFYDVFTTEDGRIAMLLGDVSGKGLPAALLMGLLHGAVRSSQWAAGVEAHEDASRRLNDLLCLRTSVERFASLFWCYYHPSEGTLRYVNAGHLPAFVINENGGSMPRLVRLEEGGPVLGVIPDASYRQGSVDFRAGDLFVLYSDGVVEATNAAEEEFGEDRLADLLLRHARRPVAEIRDEILRAVRTFVGREQIQDDLTLLVVRAGVEASPSGRLAAEEGVPELIRA